MVNNVKNTRTKSKDNVFALKKPESIISVVCPFMRLKLLNHHIPFFLAPTIIAGVMNLVRISDSLRLFLFIVSISHK